MGILNKKQPFQHFQTTANEVEKVADYYINMVIGIKQQPIYASTVRYVHSELKQKYDIEKLTPDSKKAFWIWLNNIIWQLYKWR